ncbi:penicillin-binding protein 3 [Roseisolibacter agri]|uniref:Penicillin-binding protein 3 n=1 Tax=Roseisolibacter agri TaxID=2014610 RepID=A0AA37QCQ9_9BACT|nr:penicillin-binding protein 3 [Roseisolibacter agri]
MVFAVALIGKAAQVQLFQADRWRESAARQQIADASLPAPRGLISDASGRVLVESRELVHLRVAPREVTDRDALRKRLSAAGVPAEWVKRATDVKRAWVEIPGRYLPSDVAPATAMRGVHAVPSIDRVLSTSPAVRRIVGRVDERGKPVDGIELALDSVLLGQRGTALMLRDARGGRMASPSVQSVEARPGHSVTLTLNQGLQDIAERALSEAVAKAEATGGDIVVLEPHRGEILALASQRQDPRATAATAISEPFEPGSTIKPFMAAALLQRKRTHLDEVVNTENGVWRYGKRTITDVHKAPQMSLREIIRESSNIGIVKLAMKLSPREQYETLRDLGFGAPTGVPYPAEASGTLHPPTRWSATTAASLAMGYEMAATPLQLAAAYGAIANGGLLLEPALVKEIRDAEGDVKFRHEARPVRRVMPPEIAETMRGLLRSVVDSGTATDADLASYTLGGKSGTVRRTEGGRYASGKYNAVFAGIFPVDNPQFVIIVKIDNPSGVYYGGKVASPVSKVVLQAALAARDAALDRASLAHSVLPANRDAYRPKDTVVKKAAAESALAARAAAPAVPVELQREMPAAEVGDANAEPVKVVVELPARPAPATVLPPRAVPAVQGLPVRDAVFALHRAGFRVRLADAPRSGVAPSAGRTQPVAGAVARAGAMVTLFREP